MADTEDEYSPNVPRSSSLECAEGDAELPSIVFTVDTVCKLSNLNKLRPGKVHRFLVIPLYHSHVLWSYCLCAAVRAAGKDTKEKGKDHKSRASKAHGEEFVWMLASCGPHLSFAEGNRCQQNSPLDLVEPQVVNASITALGVDGEEGEMIPFGVIPTRPGRLTSGRSFTHRQLLDMADNGRLHARVRITIARSYFVLARLVDLKDPIIEGKTETVAVQILKGEKAGGCDWTVCTPPVDSSNAPVKQETYHIHKQKLADMSNYFKSALSTGRSVKNVIEMVPGENRCVLSKFAAGELKQAVCLIYNVPLPFPLLWHRIADLSSALTKLFGKYAIMSRIYQQWERAICIVALEAASSKDLRKACTYLVMAGSIIWSCPYGSMPVAKRVVIGALADQVHRNLDDRSLQQFVKDTFASLTPSVQRSPHVPSITAAFLKHLHSVSAVRKRAVQIDIENSPQSPFIDILTKTFKNQFEYTPAIPTHRSLEKAGGDPAGDRVEFSQDMEYAYPEDFEDLGSETGAQSEAMPLYYAGVLWSIMIRTTRSEGDICFSIAHGVGHLAVGKKSHGELLTSNVPKQLKMPRLLSASISILDRKKREIERGELELTSQATPQFTLSQLEKHAVDNEVRVRVRITVARAYFDLKRLIDLDAKPIVSEERQATAEAILRGEKPDDADWEITVAEDQEKRGQGDYVPGVRRFHVRKAEFVAKSAAFKRVAEKGCAFEDIIQTRKGVNGCTLEKTIDFPVVLSLVYGTPIPLPDRSLRASTFVRALKKLFKADLLNRELYPQWERAICTAALAIDKSTLSSMNECSRLLALVWSCPYGVMPVAKRVAIVAMADMLHLNGKNDLSSVFKTISTMADASLREHPTIIESMMQFLMGVTKMRKTLVVGEEPLKEDEPIWYDGVNDDEDEYEEETFWEFVQDTCRNSCNCAIL